MDTAETRSAEFGRALQARRKKLGLRQGDLADVLGVNRRVIGELERGKTTVRLEIALRAVEALGLNLELHKR